MKNKILLFVFVLCSNNPAWPTDYAVTLPTTGYNYLTTATAFDDNLRGLLAKYEVPGGTVAIIKQNKLIVSRGYGFANIEKNIWMRPSHQMRIASVSKPISAVALLKLIQANPEKLDQPFLSVLPMLAKLVAPTDPSSRKITLRHLMQMSAGWFSDRPQDYDITVGPWSQTMLKNLHGQIPPSCDHAVAAMLAIPLDFIPGSQYSYSNINYCMVGMVINQLNHSKGASGYQKFVQKNLMAPLGLHHFAIGRILPPSANSSEAHYYFRQSSENLRHYIDRTLDGLPYGKTDLGWKNYANGGWIATSGDLAQFFHALSQGKILNSPMLTEMLTPYTLPNSEEKLMALGWDEVTNNHDQKYYFKTGTISGTQALVIMSNNGDTFVALFNSNPTNRSDFLRELRALLLNTP